MIRKILFIALALFLWSCNSSEEKKEINTEITEDVKVPVLNLVEANRLVKLPIHCMDTEYPNRLGQTLGGNEDLQSPKQLHPAFYGCFDWHSAVHGHWSLVSLLKSFPNLKHKTKASFKYIQRKHIKRDSLF